MTSELENLGDDELRAKAAEIGLEVSHGEARDSLIERIERRCAAIDEVSREELVRILRWAGQDVPDFHTREALIKRFYRLDFRDADELTLEDLRVVARLREIAFEEPISRDDLARRVERSSGHWTDIFRRAGARVAGFFGRGQSDPDPDPDPDDEEEPVLAEPREGRVMSTIKRGGKAALRALADDYIHEKLDEIEKRIDRKLDDIDRKMDEWRTKEIRHRLRILKITVIATVIVAAVSLVYTLIRHYGIS